MNILYFTRALPDALYEHLLNEGYPINNPSNQNFHSRLIAALKVCSQVECVSLLPANIASKDITRYEGWHYLLPRGLLLPLGNQLKDVRFHDYDLVIYDSLAVKLGQLALAKARERHAKTVGIITDHPKNLAKAPFYYRNGVEDLWKNTSISIAVTPTLALPDKPSFILPGLVREIDVKAHRETTPYLYFAGALSPRFGLPSLIEAYKKADLSWPLLVAGHAYEVEEKDPRIKFLGQLTERENASYQAGAALLLNPRPLNQQLDRESIPSKMFEYLASGQPIVSTAHPYFAKRFPSDIEFIGEKDFSSYFLAHRSKEGGLVGLKKNDAKEKTVNEYGISRWGEALVHFLAETMARSS